MTVRKVRLGLAKGALLPLNLRHHTHVALGLYEKEAADLVRKAISAATVFYDLGGGFGYYAIAIGRRLTKGRVYTFECDPDQVTLLRTAIEANRLEEAVEVVVAEVGDTTDLQRLRLDDFVTREGVQPPTFVKIDVEGAEARVLAGAAGILAKYHPTLFIETHSSQVDAECLQMLKDMGYEVQVREQSGHRWGPRPVEFNRWLWARPKVG